MPRPKGFKITDEQKEAMQTGRAQAKAVDQFLYFIDTGKLPEPKTGTRSVNQEAKAKKVMALREKAEQASTMTAKLELLQKVRDLEAGKALSSGSTASAPSVTEDDLTAAFVKHAKAYGDRKGIERATWEDLGVPAAVLDKAKIK